MRVQATVMSVSWIPTDSLKGALKAGMDLRLSHWDEPLPDQADAEQVRSMSRHDKFRFANVLTGWAEVEGGEIVAHGIDQTSGLVMGSTTVRVGRVGATFQAVGLPVLRREPEVVDDGVRFVQTVGGRTALPIPRPVPHPPFVRWQSPIVWTTLALTLRPDGTGHVDLSGASAFPRHWVYGADGRVALKSGLTDQMGWMAHSFGDRTPWSARDREVPVVAAETELERSLSSEIMRGDVRPEVRWLREGHELTRQSEPGDELFLVLDGVVRVEHDGRALVELGPGAIIGERALLEGGRRTSTVTAVTPARVAVAAKDAVDLDRLRALAEGHRREDTLEIDLEGAEPGDPLDLRM